MNAIEMPVGFEDYVSYTELDPGQLIRNGQLVSREIYSDFECQIMAHKVFEKPIRVHFSNCDPAGIVFHPQYFVLINELMEDFLEDVAGVGFIEIRRYGVGFPVVSVKTQFTKPSRPSDRLMGQVWVEKIGDKSIRFAFVLKDEAEERLRCVETSVCVKLTSDDQFVSWKIPAKYP